MKKVNMEARIFGAEVTLKELEPILLSFARMEDKSRLPAMFLWGPPGTGKTTLTRRIAKALEQLSIRYGLPMIDYNQLCGVPWRNPETGKWERTPLLEVPKEGQGIYVIDDFTGAPDAVQKIALDLVLERRLLDSKLGPGWLLVFCANETGGVFPMHQPIANRMTHFYVKPEYTTSFRPWSLSEGRIRSEIIGYLDGNSDDLYVAPTHQEKAFATPRSWEALSNQVKYLWGDDRADEGRVQQLDPRDRKLRIIVESNIGASVTNKFLAFLETYKLVDIELAVRGEHPSLDDRSGGDRANRQALEYALMSQCRAWWVRGRKKTKDLATGLVNVMTLIGPAFQAVLLQDLIMHDRRKMADVYRDMTSGPDKAKAKAAAGIYKQLSDVMSGDVA